MTATTREQRTERILVVEDEDAIRDLVATALRFTGFPVSTVASGRAAIAEIRNEPFDLLILDVNLPDIDGFEITRKIRADGNQVAVIFLTARDDLSDLKTGFTAGGDDYLTKPFSLEELMLRIDAILRRTGNQQPESARLTAGDVSLDQDAYQVWRGNEEISLSPTEFRLLRYLMQNQERVVSKNQILDHVWDYEYVGDLNAVETYISYLRKKLGDKDAQLIRTVRGFGYSLRSRP
jgi:two-component system, OmpR family, response regulator